MADSETAVFFLESVMACLLLNLLRTCFALHSQPSVTTHETRHDPERELMKKDKQLQKDVMEQLAFDPAVHSESIGVSVNDGVVTLSGSVPSYTEKFAAENRTFRVAGVKSVVEEIEVNIPSIFTQSDQEIAKAAADALKWNVLIPSAIKASVHDGIITLKGEVEWAFQKETSQEAVRHLRGVKGVVNMISLQTKPVASPSEVKSRIEKALTRAAKDEAKNIGVTVNDSTVVLSGHVRSHDEQDEARWAAWAIPGVSKVENHLVIS